MLVVNGLEHPFHEGMTIKTLLDEKGFVFHGIIVSLNGRVIEDTGYSGTSLHDGDIIKAIHIFAGG